MMKFKPHIHRRNWTMPGWTEYRYGSKRKSKVRMPEILVGQEREHVTQEVTEILRTWQTSAFEHEADCRHGVRSGLCAIGHPWQAADDAAADVVAEGLARIHARRPTWSEGQREYTDPVDLCIRCYRPLDDDQIARGRKFCSSVCASAHLTRVTHAREARSDLATNNAYLIVAIDRKAPKTCEHCGDQFRPRHLRKGYDDEARFCSKKCYDDHRRHDWPTLTCQNPGCGNTFKPTTEAELTKKYCSPACYHQAGATVTYERTCDCCGREFTAGTSFARFCSRTCNQHYHRHVRGGVPPKVLNTVAFDFFVARIAA